MLGEYLIPQWFFGYNVLLELVFAVVTLLVGIYAFRVYKMSGQGQSRLFAISFIFISISYFIQSLFNFLIVSELNREVCNAIKLSNINTLNALGVYSHIFFFISGLLILTYMTLKTKSIKVFSIIFILSYAMLWLSIDTMYAFYFLSSVLLAYITIYYISSYIKRRRIGNLMVLIAFAFLFFGSVHFILSINHSLFYALGHILGLVAYILILANLVMIIRK